MVNDLLVTMVLHEKSLPYKHHHVITDTATPGHQTVELFSGVNSFVGAMVAVQECFVGAKAARMKGAESSVPRLQKIGRAHF